MTWYPLSQMPVQYSDTSGNPYSGAVLKAYRAATTTVIPMATKVDGLTLAESMVLNAAGYPTSGGMVIIPHVQEDYKLALYPTQSAADANSGAIWTVDDNHIADAPSSSFVQSFSGDGTTTAFTLSTALGTDENALMIFADKKFGEYVTNGTFTVDSNWTKGAGWTIGSGVATATGAISTDLSQTLTTPIIKEEVYVVTYTITRTVGSIQPSLGTVLGTSRNASGTYTETIIAGSTSDFKFATTGFTGTVDGVSIHRATASRREILRPDEFTLSGTTLTFSEAPAAGTNNVVVFAPSTLFGSLGSLAAAAATSEANAAASATLASTAAGWKYTYDSTTITSTDPTAGFFKLNNATLSSATALYISETTAAGQAISTELASWDDSTSTVRGKLRIFKQADPTVYRVYDVTGSVVDNGAWDTVTIAHVSGNGTWADNDVMTLQFIRNGDKGNTGSAGGPLVDGNYTGVTVSGTGTVITINDASIVEAKYGTGSVSGRALEWGAVTWDHLNSALKGSLSDLIAGTIKKVVFADDLLSFLQNNNVQKIWHAQHQLAQNTNGGVKNNATWDTAPINTEVTDTIGVTLTSNQFVLPAGTYDIEAVSMIYAVGQAQLRLRNITGSTTLLTGLGVDTRTATATGEVSYLRGRFTVTASQTLELQQWSSAANATTGFGLAVNATTEVFRDVWIRRVA